MCSFMCYLSFTANLKENSWEFGILRSIGLSVNKYLYLFNFYYYKNIL